MAKKLKQSPMILPGLLTLLLLAYTFSQFATGQERSIRENREEFIEALNNLASSEFKGTDKEIILHVVGKPDDILLSGKEGVRPWAQVKEIWCYGTDRHLGCATLGQIYFNKQDELHEIAGQLGVPPKPDEISEQELRQLLRAVHDTPCLGNYDPFTMVRVVNTLHVAGEKKALIAIREYLRITNAIYEPERERILYLVQLLREAPTPPQRFVRLPFGEPRPPEPKDPAMFPRFPLWVYQDIPFLTAEYMLAGAIAPLESLVDEFQQYPFRKQPLKPTDDPLALLKVMGQLKELNYVDESWQHAPGYYFELRKDMIRKQLLRRFEKKVRLLNKDFQPADYQQLLKQKFRWNAETFEYEMVK